MKFPHLLLAAAIVVAPLPLLAAGGKAADPAPVIAAERGFAARAAEAGIKASFLENMADDAIVFDPDPVSAKASYGAQPAGKTPKEGGPLLAWWPNWAGIARSGDLGFTTGPAEVNGKRTVHYFTVWKKQADGGWKWVYDGGAPSDATKAAGPDAPVLELAAGDPKPMAADEAMAQVKAAEVGLARVAMVNSAMAYRAYLTADARVQGSKLAPATTPAAVAAELATRPQAIQFTALGGAASKAGDLAWTYGEARYQTGARGHYVRIWQRRGGQWRLVFDQILEVRS